VLKAVGELLIESGPAAVTVDAVIARSGAARATIYRHWPTRDALVLAGMSCLMPPPRPPDLEGLTTEAALSALVAGFCAQLEREPWAGALPALLDQARRRPELAARMQEFLDERKKPVRDVLAAGVRAGELRADLALDAGVSQVLGPLFFRRAVTAEPLDAAFQVAVLTGFLRGHRP
jgi:AcrR family transcriptional regulator